MRGDATGTLATSNARFRRRFGANGGENTFWGKPGAELHIQQTVCEFSLTPAHALEEHGTPTDAGRRVQGAAVWCVAVQKQRHCGRLWANFGRKRYTEGHAAHAASARWFFPTLLGVCGIFCAYQLHPCLLDPRPPCQRAACQVRPPIWASRGTGQTDGARRGTARCEVMEGCWRVPPKIVRAHIAACPRRTREGQ